jgi:toxin FitB
MAYLLDTVTVSELRDKRTREPAVVAWQASLIGESFFLSVISLNEIRYGLLKVSRSDPGFAETLAAWYDGIVANEPYLPFLPVSRTIAETAADFRAAHNCSLNDSLIAATAKVHNLTLATRNTPDFAGTGIGLVNPWDFKA